MDQKAVYAKKFHTVFYCVVLLLILLYTLFFTDVFETDSGKRVRDFSEGWTLSTGEKRSLDSIDGRLFGDTVIVEKRLPSDIHNGDSLCFQSKNVNIIARIDDREVYRFKAKENLTGKGYGFAVHEIGLDSTMAGSVIRIRYEGVIPGYLGGYLWGAGISAGSDYLRELTRQNLFLLGTSCMILFLGIVLVMIWLLMSNRSVLPFDILAFGIMALVLGLWGIIDTGLPAAFSGNVIAGRVLSRFLLVLAVYPFFCFIHSFTEKERPVYRHIMFIAVMLTMGLLLGYRYFFEKGDMIRSFVYGMIFLIFILGCTIFVMAVDDVKFCRKMEIESKLMELVPGMVLMVVCFVIEIIFFFLKLNPPGKYFTFIRLGTAGFIACVFLLFLKWWTGDRAAVDRDRFVNRALTFSVSSASPERTIYALLEYIGTEFQARRACVFEEGKDGSYRRTYEWCRNSLDRMQTDSLTISAELLSKELDEERRCMVIESRSQCEGSLAETAKIMEERDINCIVSGLVEAEGKTAGILELQDPPQERLSEIREIMSVLSYFFAQFVNQRKEQERILYYSHHDTLTGAKNLISYEEYTERTLDLSQPFGYMLCKISGLKKVNDRAGFDAGDDILKKTARKLMDTFGEENVYRIEGELFVAFGFETDETFFRNDVARAKRGIYDGQCKYYFGALFCANGTRSLDTIKKKATELMGAEQYLTVENDK